MTEPRRGPVNSSGVSPFTAEDLELYQGLHDKDVDRLFINPKCHPKAAVRIAYHMGTGILTGYCNMCGRGCLNFELRESR